MKRAVTIQDISCFGKCSVTVALPIISAMGVECAVIPTAVLSTHTGGFTGYTFRDLDEDIPKIAAHWKKENLFFDGVYTGYLGSPAQAEMIEDFIKDFSPSLVFVDPVMGDNGKLYAGFDDSIVKAMIRLCAKADVIVPNMTEATLMLGIPYKEYGEYDMDDVRQILRDLVKLGPRIAALTGVMLDGKNHGVVAYDSDTDTFTEYFAPHLPLSCHGTGDVYASTMFAALLRGRSLYDSIRIAADNTCNCIKATDGDKDHWYGVKFEKCIPALVEMMK